MEEEYKELPSFQPEIRDEHVLQLNCSNQLTITGGLARFLNSAAVSLISKN